VTLPDAPALRVPLEVEVARESSDAVLHLRGQLKVTAEGVYEAAATLEFGSEPQVAERRSSPVRFQVLAGSPLGSFSLALRRLDHDRLAEPVRIEAPPRELVGSTIEVAAEPPARVVFEWWADPRKEKACTGIEQLRIELPERPFEWTHNDLAEGKPIEEADRLICYRSLPTSIGEEAFGKPMTVRVSDGLAGFERRLVFVRPPSVLERVLRWIIGGLVVAILALAFAFFFVPPFRRRVEDAWAAHRADFPLAVDVAGESVMWEKGEPKRFLVTLDGQGAPVAETTSRPLARGQAGLEIRPEGDLHYVVRQLAGPPWQIRRLSPGVSPGRPRLLSPGGEVVAFLDLVKGERIELTQGTHTVVVRHMAR
jgi:hypothetical protein